MSSSSCPLISCRNLITRALTLLYKTRPDSFPMVSCMRDFFITRNHARIQRRGAEIRTPLKNHKTKGFLCNTGPDLLKNHEATKPACNSPHQLKNLVKIGPPLTKLSGSAHNYYSYRHYQYSTSVFNLEEIKPYNEMRINANFKTIILLKSKNMYIV